MDATARRDLALRAAMAVAQHFGVTVEHPEIVRDSNNTIVGLDERVVAKVATSALPGRETALDRELAVLNALAASDAPAVRLSDVAPRAVHEALGARMILLERLDLVDAELDAEAVLGAIDEVHAGLVGLTTTVLPSFLDSFADATAILGDPTRSPALSADDRRFTRRVADQLAVWFDAARWDDVVLHGDPWIGGNLVATVVGPRLLDFEATCTGPREWDLSSIGALADRAAGVDPELLEHCRALRSYTVAAWCWSQPARAPEVDRAARWHLHLLRQRFG